MTERETLEAEQTDLQRKLKAREDQVGYIENVRAIKARLAWIEEQLASE